MRAGTAACAAEYAGASMGCRRPTGHQRARTLGAVLMPERHLRLQRRMAAPTSSVWALFADFPNLASHADRTATRKTSTQRGSHAREDEGTQRDAGHRGDRNWCLPHRGCLPERVGLGTHGSHLARWWYQPERLVPDERRSGSLGPPTKPRDEGSPVGRWRRRRRQPPAHGRSTTPGEGLDPVGRTFRSPNALLCRGRALAHADLSVATPCAFDLRRRSPQEPISATAAIGPYRDASAKTNSAGPWGPGNVPPIQSNAQMPVIVTKRHGRSRTQIANSGPRHSRDRHATRTPPSSSFEGMSQYMGCIALSSRSATPTAPTVRSM